MCVCVCVCVHVCVCVCWKLLGIKWFVSIFKWFVLMVDEINLCNYGRSLYTSNK